MCGVCTALRTESARRRHVCGFLSWLRAGAGRGEIDSLEAPDWEGWVAGFRLSVPIVGTFQRIPQPILLPKRDNGLDQLLFCWSGLRCGEEIFTVPQAAILQSRTQHLFRLHREAIPVLYNPVELPSQTSTPRSKNQVVFSGRLIPPKKGVVSLITAWNLVRQVCSESELHIFGRDGIGYNGGSMREVSVSKIDDPVRKSVFLPRSRLSTRTLSRSSTGTAGSISVLYLEAFAIAPMEAMACCLSDDLQFTE